MTVEQLRVAMDYREYVRWDALYELEAEDRQRAMKRAQGGK